MRLEPTHAAVQNVAGSICTIDHWVLLAQSHFSLDIWWIDQSHTTLRGCWNGPRDKKVRLCKGLQWRASNQTTEAKVQESKTSAITTVSKTHPLSTITTRVNVVTNYIFPSQYAWYLAKEAPFDFTFVSRHYIKWKRADDWKDTFKIRIGFLKVTISKNSYLYTYFIIVNSWNIPLL